jgi:hypothetical protein
MTRTIIATTIGGVIGLVVGLLLGFAGPQDGVGGTYEITKQFFSAGIEVDGTTQVETLDVDGATTFGSPTATTSINFGRACWRVTTTTGSTTFVFFNSTGVLATSSNSCN